MLCAKVGLQRIALGGKPVFLEGREWGNSGRTADPMVVPLLESLLRVDAAASHPSLFVKR